MKWVQTSDTQFVNAMSEEVFNIINLTPVEESFQIREDIINLRVYTSFEKRRILQEHKYLYCNGLLFDPQRNVVPEVVINQLTAELISETMWFKEASDTRIIPKNDITATLKSYGIYPIEV